MVCRETERTEFSEAKERLKHSWAADRDDFARVKDALKKKNADHHVQNGRLAQSLKVPPDFSPPSSAARLADVAALSAQALAIHVLAWFCRHPSLGVGR